MEEIKRLVATIGMSEFRYYAFPAVSFAPMQAVPPELTLLPVVEANNVEAGAAFGLQHEVVTATSEAVVTYAQPATAPVGARYPLLVEAVETGPTLLPVAEANGTEVGADSELRREVVLTTVEVVATQSRPTTAPVRPCYPLLAEVVEAVSRPQSAIPTMNSPAAIRLAVQAASRPLRRRPRSAGRSAIGRP